MQCALACGYSISHCVGVACERNTPAQQYVTPFICYFTRIPSMRADWLVRSASAAADHVANAIAGAPTEGSRSEWSEFFVKAAVSSLF